MAGIGPTGGGLTKGLTGQQGLPGRDGEDGLEAYPIPGGPGPAGANGIAGIQGIIGPQGIDGEDGETPYPIPGPVGPLGNTGATGLAGFGPQGLDGNDGETSYPLPGPQGPIGTTGASGPAGTGPQGRDGEDGETSFPLPGPQGLIGPTGATGPAGVGPQGRDGEDGETSYPIPGPPGVGVTAPVGTTILARAIVQFAGNIGNVTNFTPVDLSATLRCTFTVPASGQVRVHILSWGILTNGFTPWTDIRDLSNVVLLSYPAGFFSGGNQSGLREFYSLITGLTPGTVLTWKWSQHTDGGGAYVVSTDTSVALMEIFDA